MDFAETKRGALRILSALFSVILLVLALSTILPFGVSANSGVSQGFTTHTTNVSPGTIMGLEPGKQHLVAPAISTHHYQLLGVVANQPLLALNDGTDQVQIILSGTTNVLVSTINGDVKAGDKITASPISGVGMKATNAGQIVGTAQGDLAKSSPTKRTITDKKGDKQTIEIGTIPMQVNVGYYSGNNSQGGLSEVLPPFVYSLANNLAGEQVSAARVLMGLIILIIGFFVVGNMLQSGIRSGITALGRNPLAKKALRRELLDVCMTALGVLVLTVIIVFLVIKL